MARRQHKLQRMVPLLLVGALLTVVPTPSPTIALNDAEPTVAVAANFTRAMREIVRRFEADTGRTVTPSFASTGTLYAQIVNGAPYDAFFAADMERPQRLEEIDEIVDDSRFTYAVGRPVLWSGDRDLVDPEGNVLETGDFRRLAMADPELAPYGKAARQVLIERGVWDELQAKIVFGRNVSQAHQYVASGSAELGFVALSQVIDPHTDVINGSHWQPPSALHDPVEQQAVILQRTDRRARAQSFMDFVRSDRGAQVIEAFGYAVPESDEPSAD